MMFSLNPSHVFIILFLSEIEAVDYCQFTDQHALCNDIGIGPKCGEDVIRKELSENEKTTIVSVHNELRSKVAAGKELQGAPGPQPKAADMQEMYWDNELANIAQSHASKCIFDHDCSDCRKTPRFHVGQNLWSGASTADQPFNPRPAIEAFYDEVKQHSHAIVEKYKFVPTTGHYTQLVWATSNRIGCGYVRYKEGRWFKEMLTCNYGPGGNFIDRPMYKVGEPCSKCSDGFSCSTKHQGLCATTDQEVNQVISTPPTLVTDESNTSVIVEEDNSDIMGTDQSSTKDLLTNLSSKSSVMSVPTSLLLATVYCLILLHRLNGRN